MGSTRQANQKHPPRSKGSGFNDEDWEQPPKKSIKSVHARREAFLKDGSPLTPQREAILEGNESDAATFSIGVGVF